MLRWRARVLISVRLLLPILLTIMSLGCSSLPVVPTGGIPREIPWQGIKLTLEMVQNESGFRLWVRYWAPSMAYAGDFAPFEGVQLVLQDGRVIESDSKAPEILDYSGGGGGADSSKAVLTYTVPGQPRPARLVLRCGLGTLECAVEDRIARMEKEKPDKY